MEQQNLGKLGAHLINKRSINQSSVELRFQVLEIARILSGRKSRRFGMVPASVRLPTSATA